MEEVSDEHMQTLLQVCYCRAYCLVSIWYAILHDIYQFVNLFSAFPAAKHIPLSLIQSKSPLIILSYSTLSNVFLILQPS